MANKLLNLTKIKDNSYQMLDIYRCENCDNKITIKTEKCGQCGGYFSGEIIDESVKIVETKDESKSNKEIEKKNIQIKNDDNYSDWLLNAVDALEDHFEEQAKHKGVARLHAFTTIGTYYTGAYLLKIDERIAPKIKIVLCFIRGLYDSLWILKLLQNNDKKRIGKLQGWYNIGLETLVESLWDDSPNAKPLMAPPFSEYYIENFQAADIDAYINSGRGPEENILLCTEYITNICEINNGAVTLAIAKIIKNALDNLRINMHLEAFDIDDTIDMSDELFE